MQAPIHSLDVRFLKKNFNRKKIRKENFLKNKHKNNLLGIGAAVIQLNLPYFPIPGSLKSASLK